MAQRHFPSGRTVSHAEQLSVQAFSSELLKQVPLKICAQSICFAEQAVTHEGIQVRINKEPGIVTFPVFKKHIYKTDGFIVPIPIRAERILPGGEGAHCQLP